MASTLQTRCFTILDGFSLSLSLFLPPSLSHFLSLVIIVRPDWLGSPRRRLSLRSRLASVRPPFQRGALITSRPPPPPGPRESLPLRCSSRFKGEQNKLINEKINERRNNVGRKRGEGGSRGGISRGLSQKLFRSSSAPSPRPQDNQHQTLSSVFTWPG